MPAGRPTTYTPEIADMICSRLSEGESLRSVCKDPEMPVASTVFAWMRKYEEFSKQYARAKEEAADAMFEEIQDIADDGTNDWMEVNNQDGDCVGWKINGEALQRSRLRVDTRKWMMSKMKPKKYGDKIQTEHSGKVEYTGLTDEQLNNKLQSLINAASKSNSTAED